MRPFSEWYSNHNVSTLTSRKYNQFGKGVAADRMAEAIRDPKYNSRHQFTRTEISLCDKLRLRKNVSHPKTSDAQFRRSQKHILNSGADCLLI